MKSNISRHTPMGRLAIKTTLASVCLHLMVPLAGFTPFGSFHSGPKLAFSAFPSPVAQDDGSQKSESQNQVTLTTLEQTVVQGELKSLGADSITLLVAGNERKFEANQIESVRFVREQSSSEATNTGAANTGANFPHLISADKSRLVTSSVHGQGNQWNLNSIAWTLSAPLTTSQLDIVRLKELDADREKQWDELLNDTEQADSVIAMRPTGELTRVAGTINEIKDGVVQFEFDGQNLEMPLERLVGLTWYRSNPPAATNGITLTTSDGSIWNTKQIEMDGAVASVVTTSQIKAKIPLGSITEIRFGDANSKWLKDVERLNAVAEFETNNKSSKPIWKLSNAASLKAFTPRFVSKEHNSQSKSSSNYDLQFIKPGTYEFRMPEGFQSLECTLYRPTEGRVRSELQIEIWQDTERVLEDTISADTESKPLRVKLESGKRVRLVVLDKNNLTAGTEIYWGQARLLK